jgi:hypothetical protein
VAIGATSFRRQVSKGKFKMFEVLIVAELLSHWQPTVTKGNAAEIGAMAESTEVCILPTRRGRADTSGSESRRRCCRVGIR